ncbi:MAG: hypothetical protein N3G19_02940 [Candidatus Pacearchaeota archaeon]|nr:hypothetical protein [Candidatus Pacearchaeota archaeon]
MAKKEAIESKGTAELLLENTIALQKILTNLATEIKSLNKKVSDILSIFEEASLAFKEAKEKGITVGAETTMPQEIIEKIDTLVEQNKTIAKGLLLLEKAVREKETKGASTGAATTRPIKTLRKKTPEEEEMSEYKPQPLPEFSF